MKALLGVGGGFFVIYLSAFLYVSFLGKPNHASYFNMALADFNQGNFERAAQITKPIAERGDPRAQHLLGHIYEFNIDPSDDAQAARWFALAKAQGFVNETLAHNENFKRRSQTL